MYKQAQSAALREILKALGYTAAGAVIGAGGGAGLTALSREEKKSYIRNILWGGLIGGLGGLGTYGAVNYAYPWMRDVAYPWMKQKLGYGSPLPRPEITRRDVFPLKGLGPYSENPVMNALYQSAEQALTPPIRFTYPE